MRIRVKTLEELDGKMPENWVDEMTWLYGRVFDVTDQTANDNVWYLDCWMVSKHDTVVVDEHLNLAGLDDNKNMAYNDTYTQLLDKVEDSYSQIEDTMSNMVDMMYQAGRKCGAREALDCVFGTIEESKERIEKHFNIKTE